VASPKYAKYMVKMSREKSKWPGGWLMSEELVPGCDINIMFNWIREKPKPNPMHLAMEAHDYPEIIFTLGMNPHHPEYLGGEIEGYIGEDRQLTTKTTALYIPGYAPHGRVSWKGFEKPHMQMAIKLSGDVSEKRNIKGETGKPAKAGDYEKCVVDKPLREVSLPMKVTGRTNPALTYMSNDLVPECNVYLEYVWIWEMPNPDTIEMSHAHDHDEIVLNIGSDPQNPADLGAEIEAYLGGEKQVTDVTSAIFIPKNVEYGPVRWTRVNRPHLQIRIMPGTGDDKDARAGGDN
jgi:hypothetical protein